VRVTTIYPGPIKTALGDAGAAKYGKSANLAPTGTPERLARLIRLASDKGKARLIYPSIYHAARYFPAMTRHLVDCFTPRVSLEPPKTNLPT
jgi:short-subunit dehydrogenase